MLIASCASVSEEEIQRLYARFERLDADESGRLSREEFLQIPEVRWARQAYTAMTEYVG